MGPGKWLAVGSLAVLALGLALVLIRFAQERLTRVRAGAFALILIGYGVVAVAAMTDASYMVYGPGVVAGYVGARRLMQNGGAFGFPEAK